MHFSRKLNRYKQVRFKDGGGIRVIEYMDSAEDFENIQKQAVILYFPNGVSLCSKIHLDSIDVHVGTIHGDRIDSFIDENGTKCSYKNYLKRLGLCPSRNYLYLLTQDVVRDSNTAVASNDILLHNEIPSNETKAIQRNASTIGSSDSTMQEISIKQTSYGSQLVECNDNVTLSDDDSEHYETILNQSMQTSCESLPDLVDKRSDTSTDQILKTSVRKQKRTKQDQYGTHNKGNKLIKFEGMHQPLGQRITNELTEIQRDQLRFNFEDEIGRGGFGVVYKGQWVGSDVAIKYVNLPSKNKDVLNPILNELAVHMKARHPNIVQLMGVAVDNTGVFIVSEYINGCDLESRLFKTRLKSNSFTRNEKHEIARDCTKAVAYLHAQNPPIVHHDIKPSNVLIDRSKRAKLCDFGLSTARNVHSMTRTVGAQGTPMYMAPECAIYNKRGDTKSDVWALGCTLLELFSGSRTWDIPNDIFSGFDFIRDLMKNGSKPTGLSKLTVFLDVVDKALELNPECRSNAIEILDLLTQ